MPIVKTKCLSAQLEEYLSAQLEQYSDTRAIAKYTWLDSVSRRTL